ncbi:MAG: PKD domain-containing protein [Thermoplasmata archaeon]|nr:PKD domain-containing protein [Thermoplasmata archaeon]
MQPTVELRPTFGVRTHSGPLAILLTASALNDDIGHSFHVTALVSGGTGPYNYTWSDNASGFLLANVSYASTYVDSPYIDGPNVVSVVVRDTADANISSNVTVYVSPPLDAAPYYLGPGGIEVFSPLYTDVGQSLTFYPNLFGGLPPYTYLWTFGDPTGPLTTPNGTHVYNAPGNYTVRLQVTDWTGATINATTEVFANATPTGRLGFPSATDSGVAEEFKLAALNGTPPFLYTLQFGDGNSSSGTIGLGRTAPLVVHPYYLTGVLTVRLTLEDAVGSFLNQSWEISIAPPPSVTSIGPPGPLQPGDSAPFLVNVTGGTQPFRYLWSFGDGADGTGPSVTHSYLTAGSYNVVVSVTDAANYTAVGYVLVVVNPTPAPNAGLIGAAETAVPAFLVGLVAGMLIMVLEARSRQRRQHPETPEPVKEDPFRIGPPRSPPALEAGPDETPPLE